jgi:hypothetical protein
MNGTTNVVDHGVWEWEIGSALTYTNIQGISADGNFYATKSLVEPVFAVGAFSSVNLLVGRYNADPALRPYAQDVDLLLDACAFDPADYGLDAALDNAAYPRSASFSRVVGSARTLGQRRSPPRAPARSPAGTSGGTSGRLARRIRGLRPGHGGRFLERRRTGASCSAATTSRRAVVGCAGARDPRYACPETSIRRSTPGLALADA